MAVLVGIRVALAVVDYLPSEQVLNRHPSDAFLSLLSLQALEKRRAVLGEDRPDTLGSLNNLADLFKSQERYEEAASLRDRIRRAGRQQEAAAESEPPSSENS